MPQKPVFGRTRHGRSQRQNEPAEALGVMCTPGAHLGASFSVSETYLSRSTWQVMLRWHEQVCFADTTVNPRRPTFFPSPQRVQDHPNRMSFDPLSGSTFTSKTISGGTWTLWVQNESGQLAALPSLRALLRIHAFGPCRRRKSLRRLLSPTGPVHVRGDGLLQASLSMRTRTTRRISIAMNAFDLR